MKKKITGALFVGIMLMIVSVMNVWSAQSDESIYNVVVQEDQGVPYVSARILDTGSMSLVYPNTVAGCNYAIAVMHERAEISNADIAYMDQKKAQGNSVSFEIDPGNLGRGEYYIFLSSDAGSGITEKTEVASFSYGLAASDAKELSDVIVKKLPAKTVYKIGEQLNADGLVLTAIYSDNSTEEITYDGSNMTFRGFDASKAVSRQRVAVIYQSREAVFTVDIVQPGTENETDSDTKQKKSLKEARILGVKSGYSYTGKVICPIPTVRIGTEVLRKGIDYDISYIDNKNTGKAILMITGKGNYTDVSLKTFKINPIASKIKISKTKYKASDLKKKAQKAKITVSGSSGKKTFQYSKKYISVSKSGIVTLKKRMPKGVYKIKVTVAAKKNYKKTVKTIKIAVK